MLLLQIKLLGITLTHYLKIKVTRCRPHVDSFSIHYLRESPFGLVACCSEGDGVDGGESRSGKGGQGGGAFLLTLVAILTDVTTIMAVTVSITMAVAVIVIVAMAVVVIHAVAIVFAVVVSVTMVIASSVCRVMSILSSLLLVIEALNYVDLNLYFFKQALSLGLSSLRRFNSLL